MRGNQPQSKHLCRLRMRWVGSLTLVGIERGGFGACSNDKNASLAKMPFLSEVLEEFLHLRVSAWAVTTQTPGHKRWYHKLSSCRVLPCYLDCHDSHYSLKLNQELDTMWEPERLTTPSSNAPSLWIPICLQGSKCQMSINIPYIFIHVPLSCQQERG